MSESLTQTFQARISLVEADSFLFDQVAKLLSQVCRKLHADIMKGMSPGELKSDYIKRYGITARQFNACRVQIEGKIRSIKALSKDQLADLKEKITKLEKKIGKLSKSKNKKKLYICKQSLDKLSTKFTSLKDIIDSERVSLCFGSKKLFKKQFSLDKTNYSTHQEWKKDWERQRNSEFFTLGSKDESGGNQTCTPYLEEDGTISLRLRLPDVMAVDRDKYFWIKGIHFKYGHKELASAIYDCKKRVELQKGRNSSFKKFGRAISFRFCCDEKGWRIFATTDIQPIEAKSRKENGVIGVDINNDHLAVVETDRYGNPLKNWTIPLVLYGKNKNQAKALIGNACKEIIEIGLQSEKPIAIEKLNFQKKKRSLKEGHVSYRRMLSSLSYNQIIQGIKSRAFKKGIEVEQVNPAYTSIIGKVKFAKKYGLTIHHSAALCIARRMLKFSEKLPRQTEVPTGRGAHVAFSVPVRNQKKSSMSYLGEVSRKLKVTLVEYYQKVKNLSSDPPKGIFVS